ncbi:hypothetical protein ACXZ66_12965 [Corynebacterium sp. S7]
MYSWFWRILPGPAWLKFIVVIILLVAVFFLLMEVVFPAVSLLSPEANVVG